MRSSPTLTLVLSLVTIQACTAEGERVGSGALVETSTCELAGSGTLGPDSFEGDVYDDAGAAVGGWSHLAPSGAFEGEASSIVCRLNGATVGDIEGLGSWNGVPGHQFNVHVQDRGTQTIERVPGTPGTVTVIASRTYRPEHATDGAADWAEGADVTVPVSIPVTIGNAGCGEVEVTFIEYDTGEAIRCTYEANESGSAYDFEECERQEEDDDGDCHRHTRGRGHDGHHGLGWGHHRCEDGQEDPSIVAGAVLEVSSVVVHIEDGSDRHPSRRAARTEVAAAFSVTPYVLETIGEPDFYRIVIWDAAGALVYTRQGDLDSGDLRVNLL